MSHLGVILLIVGGIGMVTYAFDDVASHPDHRKPDRVILYVGMLLFAIGARMNEHHLWSGVFN